MNDRATDPQMSESPECYDDLHDQCPEVWHGILRPNVTYTCGCSCHD